DVELFQSKLGSVAEDERATDVESIIELYRGEFLAGLALSGAPDFDLWVFAQREELRGCYMEALYCSRAKAHCRRTLARGSAPQSDGDAGSLGSAAGRDRAVSHVSTRPA